MKYAVLKVKKIDGVRHMSLDVILDTFHEANEYCRVMNDSTGVRVKYCYQLVSSCLDVMDHDLIKRCNNIANCLNLADICLMKNGTRSVEKAKFWFDLAKERAKIAGDLLEIIDEV